MQETSFELPFDIPRSNRTRIELKFHLESLLQGIGCYGKDGRAVGIGYTWFTHTGIGNGGLHAVATMSHRLQRALMSTGILSRQADTYILESRIIYAKDSEPKVIVSLREE